MSALDVMAWIVLIVTIIVGVIAWIILAMLPGRIARQRNHPQADAVNISGWLGALALGIFWPLALIWAFYKPGGQTTGNDAPEIERLKARIAELEGAGAASTGSKT